MNIYERVAFIFILCLIVLVIVKLINIWALASAFLIIIIIMLLYKINFDIKIESLNYKSNIFLSISEQLREVLKNILSIREEFRVAIFRLEQKMNTQKIEAEFRIENNYNELNKKIIEIENKFNLTKKSLANYISYLEESIKNRE